MRESFRQFKALEMLQEAPKGWQNGFGKYEIKLHEGSGMSGIQKEEIKEIMTEAFAKSEAAVRNFRKDAKIKKRTIIVKYRKMEALTCRIKERIRRVKQLARRSY